jgi:transposase/uncharacterized protein YerC
MTKAQHPARAEAVAAVAAGMSYRAAGQLFGVSGRSVNNWCRENGHVVSPWKPRLVAVPADQKAAGVEMIKAGRPYSEIAALLGVSGAAIAKWAKAEGLMRRPERSQVASDAFRDRRDPAARQAAIEMVANGISLGEASRHARVSLSTIQRWCRGAGVRSSAKRGPRPDATAEPSARDREILHAKRSGKTMAEIARNVGLSRQRVSHIVARWSTWEPPPPVAIRPLPAPGQALDIWGDPWVVSEARATRHRFDILFGRPPNSGRRGPAVIVTEPLAAHLAAHRHTPGQLALPIGNTTIKRLRRLLGFHWRIDRAEWWERRVDDLATLTTGAFAERHAVSAGAVVQARQALLGESRQRPDGWWRHPEMAAILLADKPRADIADHLGISVGAVGRLRWALRQEHISGS